MSTIVTLETANMYKLVVEGGKVLYLAKEIPAGTTLSVDGEPEMLCYDHEDRKFIPISYPTGAEEPFKGFVSEDDFPFIGS